RLERGDAWRMSTSGGGGYGDPYERDAALVLADVEDEYISAERARDAYGVVLVERDGALAVDKAATRERRARPRPVPPPRAPARAPVPPPDGLHAATLAIRRAEPAVPHAFCRDECPLQANPRRCPWHDRRMLDFWRLEALQQWTERHC